MNNKIAILILSIVFLVLAIPRVIFPDFDHGDEWGDSGSIIASINYDKLGFLKSHFLPLFSFSEAKPDFYTHYPPLSQILDGLWRRLFRFEGIYPYRIIALMISFLGVVLWYFSLKLLTRSYFVSILATLFYIFNPFFIYGMDGLGFFSYSNLSRNLCVFIFLYTAGLRQGNRKKYLFLLWFSLVVDSWVTYEYIVFLALFFVLYKYSFKQEDRFPSWRQLFMLFSASVFGFMAHLLQNIWHFGSISLAFADLGDIVSKRTLQNYDSSVKVNFVNWFNYVIVHNFHRAFLFPYFLIFLIFFFNYLVFQSLEKKAKEKLKPLLKLFIIFTLCGISWYILFPSHSIAHTFVLFLVMHLLSSAALGFTVFFYSVYLLIGQAKSKRFLKLAIWALAVIFVLFTGVAQSELPITRQNILRAKDFVLFRDRLTALNKMSKEDDTIGVNYYRSPFIHYYTHRAIANIFEKDSLQALPKLPRYFIFILRDSPESRQLFLFLNEKYDILFTCDSRRFPSVFFKLKE